jgi:phenylacetate-CoA ligase
MQNLACSVYGWKENKVRFNKEFEVLLEEYKLTQYFNVNSIEDYKLKKLALVLDNAYKTVPYYHKKFKELNLVPTDISSLELLNLLPVLTKEELRNNQDLMVSNHYKSSCLHEVHTSGTTGKALTLFKTSESISAQWAIWFRHRSRFGVNKGDLHVNFTGKQVTPTSQTSPPYWRFNAPANQYLINMQHVTNDKIVDIVKFLNSIEPSFYSGYPSILAEIARLAVDRGVKLNHNSRPSVIFCGAENVLTYQKDILEKWTGAKVTDQYGLTEGNCNLSKCEFNNYHEDFEFGHVECYEPELLPDGRKRGKVLGTSYSNLAMPLIRYLTGDIAIWASPEFKCPCGRSSAVIESIEGRIDDFIELNDGRRVMRFDYLFKGTDSVKEAQVCQYRIGEVVIKIVLRDDDFYNVKEKLQKEFSKWICRETKLKVLQVEFIEKSPSGKFKSVKSFINN